MDERGRKAIRESVGATRATHMRALRLSGGDGAWETVSELTSGELFLRDGQVLHSLWLDEDAHPAFDVYVLRDDESFVLVGEPRDGFDPVEHARAHLRGSAVVEDLSASHDIVSLNGPFAWELLGELLGPEIVGLPYLGGFKHEGGFLLRAGKTGEFGYDMLLPKEAMRAATSALEDVGTRFDLAWADRDALAQCMLENWFFDIRREGRGDVTPLELQLQWRTSRDRTYVGSRALEARRAAGVTRRLTMLTSASPLADCAAVTLFGERVGVVVNAGEAPLEGAWVGLAMIDLAWAHSNIDAFVVGDRPARSMTPPLPNNRSLFVNPQQHAYATRDEIEFPPLFVVP